MLATLDPVLEPTQRAGDDEMPEWTGLAALDAADVGERWACSSTWRLNGGGR
jgi:hypothetical protein